MNQENWLGLKLPDLSKVDPNRIGAWGSTFRDIAAYCWYREQAARAVLDSHVREYEHLMEQCYQAIPPEVRWDR